jgi:hypothetical protein
MSGKGMADGTSPAAASKELWNVSFLQKCLVIVAAAWHLAACGRIIGIEDLPEVAPDATPPPVYTVRGTAVGLLEPVILRFEHPDGFELLTVEQDGTFAFEAQLGDGAIYSVTLLGDPPCVIGDAFGTVSGNVPLVQLACESVLLSALAIDGPAAPEIAFEPARRNYEGDVSILQQSVHIVATTALPGSTINVAGMPVESGVPSEPIELALGQNDIDIAVANANGVQRIYRVSVMRAADIAQYVYAKASNTGSGDKFGTSIAIWGDTLVVGAPREDSDPSNGTGTPDDSLTDSGAVYVFHRTGSSWTQEAFLKASNANSSHRFGYFVAVWNDTIAVSSPQVLGAVYVFRRNGQGWTEEALLQSPHASLTNYFGDGLALWEDTLVITESLEDSSATGINGDDSLDDAPDSGAVFVFRRTESGWAQEAYIKASNTSAYDRFGGSVALWQDMLAVGAPEEDSSSTGINGVQNDEEAPQSGAVYLFQRSAGAWMQVAYVKASDAMANRKFGSRLALWENRLAVASYVQSTGAVYLFGRTDGIWVEETVIEPSAFGYPSGGGFGTSMALWGEFLAVGAPSNASAATGIDGDAFNRDALNSGAAYLFHNEGGSWVLDDFIKASNPSPGGASGLLTPPYGDFLGETLALWRNTLVLGAWGEDGGATGLDTGSASSDDNSAMDSGAVYIFH